VTGIGTSFRRLEQHWQNSRVRPRPLAALVAAAFVFFAALPAFADQGAIVSRLANRQIVEASGLAVSATIPDLAYTLNDSKNEPVVYAIKISTGQTVGRADLGKFKPEDTESLYVDPRGQMWVGDLGDNDHDRNNVSILVFPEPGPGQHKIKAAQRYRVKYSDGRANVEAMLVNPTSGQVFLASKNENGPGTVYAISALQPGVPNVATNLHVRIPGEVTDGTFSPDGSLALLRTYSSVWIADPRNWNMLREMPAPNPNKSESITLERGDQTFLVGGEGENSPLIRFALPLNAAVDKVSEKDVTQAAGKQDDDGPQPWGLPPVVADEEFGFGPRAIAGLGIAIVAALVFAAVVVRRRW
jgi:hypothetical protein